jgi:hypothetical protein
MFIEELIHFSTVGAGQLDFQDLEIMRSFHEQTMKGVGLTEKQRGLAIRILKTYEKNLDIFFNGPVSSFLENPTFKLPVRVIKYVRKISIINHPDYGRSIKLEFPFDEEKIKQIRDKRSISNTIAWDQNLTAWIFSLEESSIKFLMDFVGEDKYEFDQEFTNYLEQTLDILKNIENIVPMLALDNGLPKIVNSLENMPDLTSTDILGAVFEARKLGILTWDENIEECPEIKNLPESIKELLSSDYDEMTVVDSQKTEINVLSYVVEYLSPCLFIIPGGNEIDKLSKAYDFLQDVGIKNSEVSTMFRLPSETGENFNNFVKNNQLNGPISDETKIVFVSTKLPKSVLKSKIKFNSIVNMGTHSAHHTVKDFMKNHENLVIFSEITKFKNIRDRLSWQLHGL